MATNEVNPENNNVSGSEDTTILMSHLTLWFCWSELNMLMVEQ